MSRPDAAPVTIAQALAEARQAGLDRTDAMVLMGHHLGRARAWLIAHDDAPLAPDTLAAWRRDCTARADGVPVAYLTGVQHFHGLALAVNPAVLVPRPDTETLVDWALSLLPETVAAGQAAPRVLDLGTGSGAIALALAAARPQAQLWATDLSAGALAVARANAQRLGLALQTRQGSWWAALAGAGRFDLVVSNPPYIAGGDPHLPALRHEPTLALTPGGDGLDAIRAIVADAPAHLQPGAWLLFEHGHDQADAVAALLQAQGFDAVQSRQDLAGIRRCTGGRRT